MGSGGEMDFYKATDSGGAIGFYGFGMGSGGSISFQDFRMGSGGITDSGGSIGF